MFYSKMQYGFFIFIFVIFAVNSSFKLCAAPSSAGTAYKDISWNDDLPVARNKLLAHGLKPEGVKFDIDNEINTAIDKTDAPELLRPKLLEKTKSILQGAGLHFTTKTCDIDFGYISERYINQESKEMMVKTRLLSVKIAFFDSVAAKEILSKLSADYGEPEVTICDQELPVYLKKLELQRIKMAYLGFKFFIPKKRYEYRKGDIKISILIADYKKTGLIESTEDETAKINGKLLNDFKKNENKKHLLSRAIDKARLKARVNTLPLCKSIVTVMRLGAPFTPEMLKFEREYLDNELRPRLLLNKTNLKTSLIFNRIVNSIKNTLVAPKAPPQKIQKPKLDF